jgi:diguanylate cyclase (GGDEF)-like protein
MPTAAVVAEKVRRQVAAQPFPVPEGATLSIGVATARVEDRTEEDAVRRADAALYEAKRQGRNRVCSA